MKRLLYLLLPGFILGCGNGDGQDPASKLARASTQTRPTTARRASTEDSVSAVLRKLRPEEVSNSATDGGLTMEVKGPAKLRVGYPEKITIVLRNSSGAALVVPAVGWVARPQLSLYCNIPEEMVGIGGFRKQLPVRDNDTVSLNPGDRVTYIHEISAPVSGPASYYVGFGNDSDDVFVWTVTEEPVAGKLHALCPHLVPKRVSGMWKGGLHVTVPVRVVQTSGQVDEKLGEMTRPGLGVELRLVAVNSLIQSPSELSAAVLSRYAKSVRADDALRAHCYLGVAAMALQGVALAQVPDLLDQARDEKNPEGLRVALIGCLGELLREPVRHSEIGLNYIEAELDGKMAAAIVQGLAAIVGGSQGPVAAAAKAALEKAMRGNEKK